MEKRNFTLLKIRVFGLFSSFKLLYLQRFGRCVIRPSSGVLYRTRESTTNFRPNSLFNQVKWIVIIPLIMTGYRCKAIVSIPWEEYVVGLNLQPLDYFTWKHFLTKRLHPLQRLSCWTPEEGRRMHRPKRCKYTNKDEGSCPDILSDKNYLSSFHKYR